MQRRELRAVTPESPGHGVASYGNGLVLCSIDGALAVLTLNRPFRRNALSREMLVSLREALADLRDEARVTVVILTGSGSSFCSGVDISMEGRRTFYQPPQQIERLYQENGQDVVRALHSLPQVTIAAVNGPAVGWGACLTTCCDFRLLAREAFFRIPEIGFGMYYDVGCLYGLLALVGPALAKRMTMLGDDIDARAEGASGTGEYDEPSLEIETQSIHDIAELVQHPDVERVQAVGSIQGDGGGLFLLLHKEVGVVVLHGLTPFVAEYACDADGTTGTTRPAALNQKARAVSTRATTRGGTQSPVF